MGGSREVQVARKTKRSRTTQGSRITDPTNNVQVCSCEEPFLEPSGVQ